MNEHDLIIIGGGASGLIAAIIAKEYGVDVALVEGEKRIGRKIITTGNGRCNITNKRITSPYDGFHSHNKGFYEDTLNQLTVQDTIDLFYRLGIPMVELQKGKMYPESLQASSVVDMLKLNLEERDIPIYLESKVISMNKEHDHFIIKTKNPTNEIFKCRKLIVATGGVAAPQTGSDGSMFNMIERLGHSIFKPVPSLVQLKLDYAHLKAISGVRIDAGVHVWINNQRVRSDIDEVIFTDYGISGSSIIQVSRTASFGLSKNQKVEIEVDLYPNKSMEEVYDFFETHFSLFSYRSLMDCLNGVIHKKLIPILLKEVGIHDIHQTCDALSYDEKMRFYQLLKSWRFVCVDTNGFNQAQATIGGVDTTEVDSKTLKSKLIKNLYFCGEVLDVDGDCGGFNLQWAWSSGYVAAIHASL